MGSPQLGGPTANGGLPQSRVGGLRPGSRTCACRICNAQGTKGNVDSGPSSHGRGDHSCRGCTSYDRRCGASQNGNNSFSALVCRFRIRSVWGRRRSFRRNEYDFVPTERERDSFVKIHTGKSLQNCARPSPGRDAGGSRQSSLVHLKGGAEQFEELRRSGPQFLGFIAGCGAGCLLVEHYFLPKTASGCIAGPIVARETILNYPTVAARQRWTEHERMTVWMAPDLACFALKVTYEEQRPDGAFHLVGAKRAVKVILNTSRS